MKIKNKRVVNRGDLYFMNSGRTIGSVQRGRRPIIVLQADTISLKSLTVIVAPLTSAKKNIYLPSHIFLGEKYGLKKPSMILLEQINTVNKASLTDYIGRVDDEHILKRIDIAIKKTLGLWMYRSN